MTTAGIPSTSPLLPSLDITLYTEWQGNLLPSDMKLLHKISIKNQDEIISCVDPYSSNQNVLGAEEVVANAKELIDE